MWDEPADIESIEYAESDPAALVVIVPTVTDWGHITTEHWYRIPVKRAPTRIHVAYLAFYHPRAFENWQYSVRYMAPVQQVHVMSRRELLPEEAAHPRANELYYRFDLAELEELPHPIISENLRRITFIPTRLSLLYSSTEIGQLWDRETAVDRLKKALEIREVPCASPYTISMEDHAIQVDLAIPCTSGGVGVLCGLVDPSKEQPQEWDILIFRPESILNDVAGCTDAIVSHIYLRGGLQTAE